MIIKKKFDDVANKSSVNYTPIEKVGMSNISLFIKMASGEKIPAKIDIFVNLILSKKGIHMSRLYIEIQNFFENNLFELKNMKKLLKNFINSQNGLSSKSFFNIKFNYPLKRKSLLSNNYGWNNYPISFSFDYNDKLNIGFSTTITYSSTCPCSASLSREVIKENFQRDFKGECTINKEVVEQWLLKEESINATAHAQRSEAFFKLSLKDENFDYEEFINIIEKSLVTIVQTAVKKEDEQAFAKLNGENLMFCEDSVRRLRDCLKTMDFVKKYYVKVSHMESLHQHDAVAIIEG